MRRPQTNTKEEEPPPSNPTPLEATAVPAAPSIHPESVSGQTTTMKGPSKTMGFKVDTTKAQKQLILPKGRYIGVKTKWERGESSTSRPMYTRTFVLSDDNEPVNGIENRAGNLVQTDEQIDPAGTELMHWSMPDEKGLSAWMNDVIAMGAPADDVIDNPNLDCDEVEAATVGQPVILLVDIDRKQNPAQPKNTIRGILPEGA